MIEWNKSRPSLEYEVSVGHMRVIVDGTSREDAICKARKQLSSDMPRMWDVIHNLAPNRFEVTCRTQFK